MGFTIKTYGNCKAVARFEGSSCDFLFAYTTLDNLNRKLENIEQYKYVLGHIYHLNHIFRKAYERDERNLAIVSEPIQLPHLIQCVATYRTSCSWFNTCRKEIGLLYLLEGAIEDYLNRIHHPDTDELMEWMDIVSLKYANSTEKLNFCIDYLNGWCEKPAKERESLIDFFRYTNLAMVLGKEFMLRMEEQSL